MTVDRSILGDSSCAHCGYDLSGTIVAGGAKCPECGNPFSLSVSRRKGQDIAWLCALTPALVALITAFWSFFYEIVNFLSPWDDEPLILTSIIVSGGTLGFLVWIRKRFRDFASPTRYFVITALWFFLLWYWWWWADVY